MTMSSLALTLSFAALLFLLLAALLWSRWPAWLKTLLIVAVSTLYFYGHHTLEQLAGRPSSSPLPQRFVVLAAAVDEPTSRTSGWIYLWVSELADERSALAPRAYRLHYSKPLHTEVEQGLKRGREGVSQMGTAEVKAGQRKGFGWLLPGNDEQEVKIRDLPAPQLPEK
jgi:hypothetical protein